TINLHDLIVDFLAYLKNNCLVNIYLFFLAGANIQTPSVTNQTF
ncbi:MAG: hypothetical protein ACI82E_000479, partial [Nonlabens sp.]